VTINFTANPPEANNQFPFTRKIECSSLFHYDGTDDFLQTGDT
jgi:hypothetical protein